jgi:hypothetical protein
MKTLQFQDQVKPVRGLVRLYECARDLSDAELQRLAQGMGPSDTRLLQQVENLVTNSGYEVLAEALRGGARPTRIAVGTDNTAPVAANTALGAEVYQRDISGANYSVNAIAFYALIPTTAANGSALVEAGLFRAVQVGESDPKLFARVTYAVVDKLPTVAIAITWTITFPVN